MLAVFVIIILLFIWVNSMFPAELSSRESGWVQRLLQSVLDFVYSGRIQASLDALAARLPGTLGRAVVGLKQSLDGLLAQGPEYVVRKAAHFSEYALLGFFVELLAASLSGRLRFLVPEGLCLAVALIDECIQFFSDGRSAQLKDVFIDLSGATIGVLLALLLIAIFGKRGEKSYLPSHLERKAGSE